VPEADGIDVTDNAGAHRYELRVDGALAALAVYELHPGRIVFVHTETKDGFEGRGLAGRLAAAALDDARARDLLVVPRCPYIAEYIRRHPEYEDLTRPRR